jgi:hypothetical protein
VVGGVEAGAFKYHAHRPNHLDQGILVALRAAFERRIAERLLAFEMNPTGFTPVSIDRHKSNSPKQQARL